MKRLSIAFLTAALLLGITTSCKKYEEGPGLSLKSKDARAAQNWEAKYVFQDGVDYTAWFTEWSIDMGEDGRILITDLADDDSTIVTQAGFWDLVNDKDELQLLFTEPRVDPDRKLYTITRLTSKEFWFKEFTDSTTWEFRLIPVGTDSTGQ